MKKSLTDAQRAEIAKLTEMAIEWHSVKRNHTTRPDLYAVRCIPFNTVWDTVYVTAELAREAVALVLNPETALDLDDYEIIQCSNLEVNIMGGCKIQAQCVSIGIGMAIGKSGPDKRMAVNFVFRDYNGSGGAVGTAKVYMSVDESSQYTIGEWYNFQCSAVERNAEVKPYGTF